MLIWLRSDYQSRLTAAVAAQRFQDLLPSILTSASRLAFETFRTPPFAEPSALQAALVLESEPADRILDCMNPYRYITITTAAFLFVMFVLLGLGLVFSPLQDEPWPTIRG